MNSPNPWGMQKELVMEFKRQRGATLTSGIIAIFIGGFF
jgi:hypothetical protein